MLLLLSALAYPNTPLWVVHRWKWSSTIRALFVFLQQNREERQLPQESLPVSLKCLPEATLLLPAALTPWGFTSQGHGSG